MDSTRTPHPAKSPAQPFAPISNLTPSNLPSAVAQPHPFALSSNSDAQPLTAPIQSASIDFAHSAMSQAQPLAQALNTSAPAGIPAVRPVTTESAPQSDAIPSTQQPSDIYPHQVHGLGGANCDGAVPAGLQFGRGGCKEGTNGRRYARSRERHPLIGTTA
ncbi:hypothetical protein N7470_005195 [Penicillium chermesinum]|nr:hypothetical protein N7470_005195 [Penicillium chermesinum]